MNRGLINGIGIAAIALLLASLAFVLEERSAMMVTHPKADAVLDQTSITVQSVNRYSAEERRAALQWMGAMNALVIRTNQNFNGCPHCPPSLADDVRAMVHHTDANINGKGGALYQATKLMGDTNASLNDDKTGLLPSASLAVLVAASSVKDVSEAVLPVAQHADDLVSSPTIKSTIGHMDRSMAHVEGILEDGHLKADKFVHPSKKQQVWNHIREGLSVTALLLRSLL